MGVCLGNGAEVTLVLDDDSGSNGSKVLAIGGVSFANRQGVGRCCLCCLGAHSLWLLDVT